MSAGDWTTFRALASVAVPRRVEQLATLLSAIPRAADERFTTADLGCGEGRLAWAVLTAFPRSTVVALDGDPAMRREAEGRLSPFGSRAEVRHFDLFDSGWLQGLPAVDCFVSSLALHHLDDRGKRALFARARDRLTEAGALLIADIIRPASESSRALWADAWDRSARALAARAGQEALYRLFLESRWNLFRYPDPEFDRPSTLAEQLSWLGEAGFSGVECFWLEAGHAVFGGYAGQAGPVLDWDVASGVASRACDG